MRLKRKALFILPLLVVLNGCAAATAPPNIQPSIKRIEILKRIEELQKTVIGVHDAKPSGISKERADLIVKFTLVANDAVHASATGWQNTVKSGWHTLNEQLKTNLKLEPGLQTIWNLVDALIGAL